MRSVAPLNTSSTTRLAPRPRSPLLQRTVRMSAAGGPLHWRREANAVLRLLPMCCAAAAAAATCVGCRPMHAATTIAPPFTQRVRRTRGYHKL